jgi:hypothetical protein
VAIAVPASQQPSASIYAETARLWSAIDIVKKLSQGAIPATGGDNSSLGLSDND